MSEQTFLDKFKMAIDGTNDGYAEDGAYLSVSLTILSDGKAIFQHTDLSHGTQIQTYLIDLATLEEHYMRQYEEEGGDEEFGSVEKMWVPVELFEKIGEKLETIA